MFLESLQRLLDQIGQVLVLSLRVVYLVPDIDLIKSYVRRLFLNMLNTGRICL